MNREILFRGKRISNGEWMYGYYLKERTCDEIQHIIVDEDGEYYLINLKTRGQFTGLTDRNGVRIFEGDILTQNNHKYVVEWSYGCAMFVLPCITDEKRESDFTIYYGYEVEIVGNVYDNPELLK